MSGSSKGIQALQEAVKKGDIASVRASLTDDPALLNETNEHGQSSFLLAKYYRQKDVAAYLLSLHPTLDLFDTCAAGHTQQALEEIDRTPERLTEHSSDGWTPLHLAAFFGHRELAKALLNRGVPIDTRSSNAMHNTPLHAAAAGAQNDLVQLLLESGADANARQHGGWTALHAAAQTGNRTMANLLIAHSADRRIAADNGQTPLDMALLHAHGEMVSLLEEQSVDEA